MLINENAYQTSLAKNKGKTFSVEGGADECFRYFVSCYEAAKPPVSIDLEKCTDAVIESENTSITMLRFRAKSYARALLNSVKEQLAEQGVEINYNVN